MAVQVAVPNHRRTTYGKKKEDEWWPESDNQGLSK
jgi:hypothetical protein